MVHDLKNMPTGDYTLAKITDVTEEHFPDVFNALIDSQELPWEDVDSPGFLEKALFVGWLMVERDLHKVLACMTTDGQVCFHTRSGLGLTRTDNKNMRLVEPWVFAGDKRDAKRPYQRQILALCQYNFLEADLAVTVKVDKPIWFVTFRVACRHVGEGMGLLEGVACEGDEEEDEEGAGGEEGKMEAVGIAPVLQRLFAFVKRDPEVEADCVDELEEDLESAWPAFKHF
jgi:hypothetical protein